MDMLVQKSDSSVVQKWSGTVAKVKLPHQTGGDVTFVGGKRPVDLGDYVLVAAIEVTEAIGVDQKHGEATVVVSGESVTVTYPAIAMTAQEVWDRDIAETDRTMPRMMEDHIELAHAGVTGNTFSQAAYDAKKVVRGRQP